MIRESIDELIDEICSEVNCEIGMIILYDEKRISKLDTFKLWVERSILVVWDHLLRATCIHREKEYTASSGPETGWEEFVCKRCGKYWSYIYY